MVIARLDSIRGFKNRRTGGRTGMYNRTSVSQRGISTVSKHKEGGIKTSQFSYYYLLSRQRRLSIMSSRPQENSSQIQLNQQVNVYIQRCHEALSMGIPYYALPLIVREMNTKDPPQHRCSVVDSNTLDLQQVKDADHQLMAIIASFQSAQL